MKIRNLLYLIIGISILSTGCRATELPNVAEYARSQGWRLYDTPPAVVLPNAVIAPLLFFDKGNSVPSCGVLVQTKTKNPLSFIGIVESEEGVNFPQCLAIPRAIPFKLEGVHYVSVEFVARETREDIYRGFYYFRQIPEKGFVVDSRLTEAVPNTASDISAVTPPLSRKFDGVRLARAAHIAKSNTNWRMLDREFISTPTASFAILDNMHTKECLFVSETGAAPLAIKNTDVSPGSKCISVLASSKLETPSGLYFIGMFKAQGNKNLVVITMVRPDGSLTVEKTLADTLNVSGATTNMKVAKAALLAGIR